MLAKKQFKKSVLSLSLPIWRHHCPQLCFLTALGVWSSCGFAQDVGTQTEFVQELKKEAVTQDFKTAQSKKEFIDLPEKKPIQDPVMQDSTAILNPSQKTKLNGFKAIEFDELAQLPITQIDQNLVNNIYQVADKAKQEAQAYRAGQIKDVIVADATKQEIAQINSAPVNVDVLMQSIQADRNIVVHANEMGESIGDVTGLDTLEAEDMEQPGFFKRLLYRVRPPRDFSASVKRISAEINVTNTTLPENISPADYTFALKNLENNLKAKLSSFTQESFSDFGSSLPQLRSLSNQAAQAVGFYNAEFKFEQMSDAKVRVNVIPNAPILVQSQNIEFSGAGEKQSQFQVLRVLPDLDEGSIFHHGLYENTKTRITTAASNNGYFDAYWRLHDVKVEQPQNRADINLRYETGDRYKIAKPVFRMSDPNKEFPLDLDVLESMVSWKDGADYAFWRVNSLANNLTNSRYFNYTLVDAAIPDPLELPLELAPDLQALVDAQQVDVGRLLTQKTKPDVSKTEVTQNVVDENQFAGTTLQNVDQEDILRLRIQQQDRQAEKESLKVQARDEKKVPVLVVLNADQLNALEAGVGYGTDTGARLRGQYRRAIVNKRGHSFDSNLELSSIRQSVDGRYSIPYHHPLNDYINIVGGYEREERENVVQDNNLIIESGVFGADRVIKNPRGRWQHTFGARYRLDRLTAVGYIDPTEVPAQFATKGEQESLLMGYEISRIMSNQRVNPTKGFKQTYKVEVGSENLLTDTNMAIVNAGFNGLYSWGETADHQFVGRAHFGYIFSNDFKDVPYNLRYFTGGDQTIRGFDYKSLSPEENNYKIGGQSLGVGSVEYNYQFKPGWRGAVFSDFGNAYDEKFSNPTAYSVGLGLRWASPIGPIRIDVASGISDANYPIRIHFFIGSAL